jgi:serine protease Do
MAAARMPRVPFVLLLALFLILPVRALAAEPMPELVRRVPPSSIAELQRIETTVRTLTKKLLPCTVGVQVGPSQGSGVIIDAEGHVLTAAHVIGAPGRKVTLTLSDGRELRGKTLGVNRESDAGLIQITDKGDWPHAELADLATLHAGDWVLALGHPGGYQKDRPAVLRFGRILLRADHVLQTDCTLVGGDSGGPLFDMDGQVVGIHSRIGRSTNWNFHVPVTAFQKDWKRLVASEAFGDEEEPDSGAFLGVGGEDRPEGGCVVTAVGEGLPAEQAGIQVGDVITQFDGRAVRGFDHLARMVSRHEPGEEVTLEFTRGDETFTKKIKLGTRE